MTPQRIPQPDSPLIPPWFWQGLCCFIASLVLVGGKVQASHPTQQLTTWQKPFDYTSAELVYMHTPIDDTEKAWHLCALYPHLKDPYWLGVNYGMVNEAQRLGVRLTVLEAGGYPHIDNQLLQIQQCIDKQADAIVIGAVSYDKLETAVTQAAKQIPVIAAINDISNPGISAKVGVSWRTMGKTVGQYLTAKHPAGSASVNIAWFPGPAGAGWVDFINAGFREGIKGSSANITRIKWGDTGKEIQRNLLQEVLDSNVKIDYIVGTALTAEAAMGELLNQGLRGKIKVISTYMTQNVLRGIKRGHILAAPNDAPVLQGQLAIEQAVRVLQNDMTKAHIGPAIELIDKHNVSSFDQESVLPPSTYWPTFVVPANH